MANGAFNFKDNSGNIVSFISGSDSDIIMSGGTLDLSGMTGLTLGNLTMEGTVETASFAPSYLLTSSFNSYTGTTDNIIGTLQTSTGSLNSFSSSTTSRLSSIETSTGSLNSFTSSTTTRLNSVETSTGSLNSYTSSNITNINAIHTSTGSLNSFTSSATNRLSSIEGVSGSYATTGSNQFKNDQVITGSLTVTGFIDTQELRTTFISSSILYRSGSTKFGDELSDTHDFTGSLNISGSISIPGSGLISGSSQVISSLPSGTVSGSAQVDVMSTTNIARLATTGSNVFKNNQTITGSLIVTSEINFPNSKISVGVFPTTSGTDVVAIGYAPSATGNNTIAIGYNPKTEIPGQFGSNSNNSIAIGYNPYAGGNNSIAIGYSAITKFANSINIGDAIFASGSYVWSTGSFSVGKSTTNATLDVNGNTIVSGSLTTTGTITIGGSASTTQLNMLTGSSSTQNVMAEFYNNDYTSGTRNFIRVRNGLNSGGTMSSYFGQGQDGKTYIISNDFTKNHIVIDGNNTFVGINKNTPNTQLDVNGNTTVRGSLTTTGTINGLSLPNDLFAQQFLLMGS